MKLVIAGSRTIEPTSDLILDLFEYFKLADRVTEIVCGEARGVDAAGRKFAEDMEVMDGTIYVVKSFYPDWDTHGKSAGYKRNLEMGQYADALLLIWDGESKGSGHMKDIMRKLNKPVYEIVLREE